MNKRSSVEDINVCLLHFEDLTEFSVFVYASKSSFLRVSNPPYFRKRREHHKVNAKSDLTNASKNITYLRIELIAKSELEIPSI